MWGYKPIPNATTPDQELATLDDWSRAQDNTPWYRFSTPRSAGSDPGELTEAVGDQDAVKSTTMGIKNLQRVSKMLLTATTSDASEKGKPYEDLQELYGRMLGQWTLELNHVAAIVGGFNTQQKNIGQQGVIFNPVPKARQMQGVIFNPVPKTRQMEAVRFLNDNAFASPTWQVDKDILRRIEPIGVLSRIVADEIFRYDRVIGET